MGLAPTPQARLRHPLPNSPAYTGSCGAPLSAPEPPFETKRGSLPCPTPRRRRKPCQLSAGAIPHPGRAGANAPKSAFLRLLTDGLTLGMRHELAPTAQWVGRGKVHGGNALS